MGYQDEMNDYGGRELTSEQLKNLREQTQELLREAVMDGDAARLIKLDGEIRNLNSRIYAATVKETAQTIQLTIAEKADVLKEIEELRELKGIKNRQLGRAMAVAERRGLAVQKVQVQIEISENKLTNARVALRELHKKLNALKEAKLEELNNEHKKYEIGIGV